MKIIRAAGVSALFVGYCLALSACGGGSATVPRSQNQPVGSMAGSKAAASSLNVAAPAPTATPAFTDWATYQYDNQRDGFNPNSATLTTAAINAGKLRLVWQATLGDNRTQTQPILLTKKGPNGDPLLIVGGDSGNAYGYDALTGAQVWKTFLGQLTYGCNGKKSGMSFGVQGTAVYDGSSSIYVPDSQGATPQINGDPAGGTAYVYKLDARTGAILGRVSIAPSPLPAQAPKPEIDFVHTGLTLANGYLYAGTGTTCDITPWRGRVVAVDPVAMTLASTFFTTFGQGANYGGGGVWGWGGASADLSGNMYIGTGNADIHPQSAPYANTQTEHDGYGEHMIRLSPQLAYEASQLPTFMYGTGLDKDLDFSGTPVLFQPPGCPLIAASQGKAGELVIYNAALNSAPIATFQLSQNTYFANYIGNPGYSPTTGLLYAADASSTNTLYPPGMVAIAHSPGCSSFSVAWHTAFGPDSYSFAGQDVPRSAPTVTAGGVVLMGTPSTAKGNPGGALWALDATTGAILKGGVPLLQTAGTIRMAPVVDGNWLWVIDQKGHLYGYARS